MPNVLAIDVGSSSVRAIVFNERLTPIAHATERYTFTLTPDGGATVDPLFLRTLVERCIDSVLQTLREPIAGIGFSTIVGNFLGVDAQGVPVTSISTYADSRAAAQIETLRHEIDVISAWQRTGCPHHTAYHPARLRWYHDHGIDAARWLDFATYCYDNWFGERAACSYSVASWSGLLNREALAWDRDWLEVLQLSPDQLPDLADYDSTIDGSQLVSAYRDRWPMLTRARFTLAIGDGAAANVGAGGLDGSVVLTVGTTAAIRKIVHSPDALPTVPPGLWAYRVTRDLHLIGGATTEGGNMYAWAQRTLNLPDPATIERYLLERPPVPSDLTMLPFLGGERSPGYDPHATGVIAGLRFATTPLEILYAALESVALRLAIIAELMDAPDQPIIAGGGALAASSAWTQIIADALDRPLRLLADHETSARGAAILAFRALSIAIEESPTIAQPVAPRAAYVAAMKGALETHRTLYTIFN